MERLNSIEELRALQERMTADRNPKLPVIVISAGTCGQASGAKDLIRIAKREILASGLAATVGLRITGCHGFCQAEPSVLVEPEGTFYPKLGVSEMAGQSAGLSLACGGYLCVGLLNRRCKYDIDPIVIGLGCAGRKPLAA